MAPIIIALDSLTLEESIKIAETASKKVWGFKIHELFFKEGPEIIKEFKNHGKVFVDSKFHDIPNTVSLEAKTLSDHGADLITLHASGGLEMLKETSSVVSPEKLVVVTVLTSLSPEDVEDTYGGSVEEIVLKFAERAHEAGIKNVVCSPKEINIVKEKFPELNIITPGIRAEEDKSDDQKRTMSAKSALDAGANLLVIGRPITKAPDPEQALEKLIKGLN